MSLKKDFKKNMGEVKNKTLERNMDHNKILFESAD